MKRLLLLFAAFAFIGCGGKEKSGNKDVASPDSGIGIQLVENQTQDPASNNSKPSFTAESPASVFEAWQTASVERDIEGLMECLTEESQRGIVDMLIGSARLMGKGGRLGGEDSPAPISSLEKVMTRHGLSQPVLESIDDGNYPVKDKAKLVGEFFEAMELKGSDKLPVLWESLIQPIGNLSDIRVEEDRAIGVIVREISRTTIRFNKVSEGWLIDLDGSGGPAPPEGWPLLSYSADEWEKNELSSEEIEQVAEILASVHQLASFDDEQKLLLSRIPDLLHWDEDFTTEHLEDSFDTLLRLQDEPYTGFTRLGFGQFRRWENGVGIFSASYRANLQEGYKSSQSWGLAKQSDHPKRGTMMNWNSAGQLVGKTLFKDGKQDGLSFMSYPNGQRLSEGLFVDGQRQGPRTRWHENGQKKSVYTFKNGLRDGPYTNWYENGKRSSQSAYKNGKRHGEYKRWHKNGQLWAVRMHKEGVTVSQQWWNSEGEEVATEEEARK